MNRREAIKIASSGIAALFAGQTMPAAAASTSPVNDKPFFSTTRRFTGGKLVWRGLEVIPRGMFDLLEVLNDAPLFGHSRGTFLFHGMRSRLIAEDMRHELTIPFRYRETDWNLFSMPDGTLREVWFPDAHGKPAYPYVDVPGLISDFAAKTGRYPELTLEFETGASHRDPQLQE